MGDLHHIDLRQIEEFLKEELNDWKQSWAFQKLRVLTYDPEGSPTPTKWVDARTLPRYISTPLTEIAFGVATRELITFILDTKTLQFPQLEYGWVPPSVREEIEELGSADIPLWKTTADTKEGALSRKEKMKLHWDDERYPNSGNFENPFSQAGEIKFPTIGQTDYWREKLLFISNRHVHLERLTQIFEPKFMSTASSPVIAIDDTETVAWRVMGTTFKQLDKAFLKAGLTCHRHGGSTNWDQHTVITPLDGPEKTRETIVACAENKIVISLKKGLLTDIPALRPDHFQDWS